MLKFLKWLLAFAGFAGLIVAAVLLGTSIGPSIVTLLNAARQGGLNFADPSTMVWIVTGVAAGSGLLLGLGLGMPSRTVGSIRKAAMQEVATRRESQIRALAVDQATHHGETAQPASKSKSVQPSHDQSTVSTDPEEASIKAAPSPLDQAIAKREDELKHPVVNPQPDNDPTAGIASTTTKRAQD